MNNIKFYKYSIYEGHSKVLQDFTNARNNLAAHDTFDELVKAIAALWNTDHALYSL